MRVLTDTHALVWALSDPEALSAEARRTLTEAEVTASVVNLWELVLKMRKSDALLADPLPWWEKYVLHTHIPTLAIRTAHVMTLGRLPEIHKDPFDRMLVAQSLAEKLPLVSKDAQLEQYGVRVIW
jgi:PIN domain nuclease of toxin-antitoxin system